MALNAQSADRISRRRGFLDELIRKRGIQQYGLFSVTTEGKQLPDGSESASGFLIDGESRVFFFWLDWDDRLRHIVFTDWKQVKAEPEWEGDEEYQAARRAAGLS